MMITMHRMRQVAAACVAAWALVACGGGGGKVDASGSGTPQSTGFAGQDASAPALTNNVATDGLNWINYRRAQIGMPALTHNAVIDKAAQSHSDYQRLNNVVSHDETSGQQGFTGATVGARLQKAGYVFTGTNAVGEVISATSNNSGFYMAEELITAIYHRFVIFEPVFQEIGSGAAATSAGYNYFTADFVTNNGYGAGITAGTIVTWPFNGQTGVPTSFDSDNEEPDPVPGVNTVGYPVSVHANLTRKLSVQSFTIQAHGSGSNLSTRLLAPGQDANMSTTGAAAIIPLTPLTSATTYDVSFIGTIDGVAVNRSWSFTTK